MAEKTFSRRAFLKKLVLAGTGIALGVYGVSQLFKEREWCEPEEPGLWKWSREAYHYVDSGEHVTCQVCPNTCVLREGQRSVCRNKTNYRGKLYTLAYGNPCAVHTDPIEKKPLFHFLPSTSAFSLGTAGCTFRCLNCINWEISQRGPQTGDGDLFPEQVVEQATQSDCPSIAYTYSEPTAWFEYMYDTSRLARSQGVKNVWVTNGSMNETPLRDLCQYLDAANVDLKSFSEEIYDTLNRGRLEPVLNTLRILKEEGVWIEVTNLVIPTWTDDLGMIAGMCEWLYRTLGPDYPLHFSRFYPAHKLLSLPPTPHETLVEAREIALDAGLHYVYIKDVPGSKGQHTYCPHCERLIVGRKGFSVTEIHVGAGACEYCGHTIEGVWTLSQSL